MTIAEDKAALFRSLHAGAGPLVLPNAWDVASACVIADAGALAIATTSAGVAWSLGAADGDRISMDRAVDVVARICAAVDVPVTADLEGGLAATADGVADIVRAVAAAGAVGINIEDSVPGGAAPLRPVDEQCERIVAARRGADAAGVALFVNARIDTYYTGAGEPATRLPDTLARAAAYLAAGADGIFVPSVGDPELIATLAKEIDAPLNVMAGVGSPSPAEFGTLGVARISVGPFIASAAYAVAARAARQLLTDGTYDALEGGLGYGALNALVAGGLAER